MPGRHKNGFSLVEMLIALAVSAIIIAAAFGSYAMIARNFDFQKDMKYIAQSARAVVDMINSDIRLAGYTAVDNGAITDAVMLADSGTAACCDAISVVYDQTPTERRQVTYYTKQYTSDDTRFRLYKHICQITTPLTIAEIQAGQCSATATLLAENPIADYVEDLQFLGSRGNCAPGDVEYGCGAIQEITPISTDYVYYGGNGTSICPANALGSFDGNKATYWACTKPGLVSQYNAHYLRLTFPSIFRLTKVIINGSLGNADGGSFDLSQGENGVTVATGYEGYLGAVSPFGITRGLNSRIRLIRGGNDPHVTGAGWTCTWHDETKCTGYGLNGALSHRLKYSDYIRIKPISATEINITSGVEDIYITASEYLTIHFLGMGQVCSYDNSHPGWDNRMSAANGKCALGNIGANFQRLELPDMKFYGEVYGGAISATEIETSILIRSPNEHGNVDRSVGSPLTLGNRTNSWSDKHLRDSFTTATVVRNLYYSSQ